MVSIGSKGAASVIQRLLGNESDKSKKILESLASGKRINSASDDAAGLAIAENLKAGSMIADQASKNISSAISLAQVRDSTAEQIGELEQRRGELAAQAANGTMSDEQLNVLNAEYQQLGAEIERITESASFNGQKVFSGESTSFQVGLDGSKNSSIELSGITSESLISSGDLLTQENAALALDQSKEVIANVSKLRGEAGATVSRIEVALNNVQTFRDNSREAEARIRDANVAQLTADNVANQIRTQAGTSALQLNNLSAQNVLALLG